MDSLRALPDTGALRLDRQPASARILGPFQAPCRRSRKVACASGTVLRRACLTGIARPGDKVAALRARLVRCCAGGADRADGARMAPRGVAGPQTHDQARIRKQDRADRLLLLRAARRRRDQRRAGVRRQFCRALRRRSRPLADGSARALQGPGGEQRRAPPADRRLAPGRDPPRPWPQDLPHRRGLRYACLSA